MTYNQEIICIYKKKNHLVGPSTQMEGRLSCSSDQLMHSKMEGIDSWIHISHLKGLLHHTGLQRELLTFKLTLRNNTLIIRKHQHQDEKKMKSEIDGCPKKLDLTHVIALKFSSQFLGLLHISKWGFHPAPHHGHILYKFQKSNCWVCGQLPASGTSGLP